jgi:hypothetical protein
LIHPDGGGAYAISYNAQKLIEKMAPENRPNIITLGHLHQMANFEVVGVDAYMAGCFESQSIYLKRKGLYPAIGGWILEIFVEGGEVRQVAQHKVRWATPILKDY